MALNTARRRAWIGIALLLGIVAFAAGAWGLQRWAPFQHDASAVTWPENVQPIAEYVQQTTRSTFQSPLTIEFIGPEAQYAERVASPDLPTSDEMVASAKVDDAVGRALGLWAGQSSVLQNETVINDLEPNPVTYLPDEHAIVVNAISDTSRLPALVRAELALVLTQALDDQLYHTVQRAQTAATSQDFQVMVGLSIGHAFLVRDLFVADMNSSDRQAYEHALLRRYDDYRDSISVVPTTYVSMRTMAQQVGPVFLAALQEDDPRLVQAAFSTDTPAALDQMILPASKYLRRDPLEAVSAPPAPLGAKVQYSNQLGPFGLYLMLSTGLPSNEALTASDGWGNDRYTVYLLAGRACLDLHVVADSRDDADLLERGLNGWAGARPPSSDALVGRDGVNLYATVCDPGTTARQQVPGELVISEFTGRSSMMYEYITRTGKPDRAECIAVQFHTQFTQRDLETYDPDLDPYGELESIEEDCRDST
ncbi:MAG: hypothetical protein Q7V88_02475 [Actinomycetota bacterium]|nr:hypothetical protein [Actinomycetota bacterium]